MFLLTFAVHSQAQRIVDSLNQSFRSAKHDTDKINCLFALGEALIGSDPDTVLIIQKIAEQLAEKGLVSGPLSTLPDRQAGLLKKKYLFSLAEALNNIGYIYDDQGEIPKALEYYYRSLKIMEDIGNKEGIATSLNNIGYIYNSQGDIPKALEYFHKSLIIREDIGNKEGIANSLNSMGRIYMNQGDIHKALEYFHKSLKLGEETRLLDGQVGNKQGIATSLNNIGFMYRNHGDPSVTSSKEASLRAGIPKALEYYHKSLKIYEEIGNKEGIATSLNNIGYIYKNQGDIPKALEYYYKSLKIRENIGNKQGIAVSLNNIARSMLIQGQVVEAGEQAERSLEIAREIGSPSQMMYTAGTLKK